MKLIKKIGKVLLSPIFWTVIWVVLGIIAFFSFLLMGFIITPIAIITDNKESLVRQVEEYINKLK